MSCIHVCFVISNICMGSQSSFKSLLLCIPNLLKQTINLSMMIVILLCISWFTSFSAWLMALNRVCSVTSLCFSISDTYVLIVNNEILVCLPWLRSQDNTGWYWYMWHWVNNNLNTNELQHVADRDISRCLYYLSNMQVIWRTDLTLIM